MRQPRDRFDRRPRTPDSISDDEPVWQPPFEASFACGLARLAAWRKWSRARGLFRAPGHINKTSPLRSRYGGIDRPFRQWCPGRSGLRAGAGFCLNPVVAVQKPNNRSPRLTVGRRRRHARSEHFRRGASIGWSGRRRGSAARRHDASAVSHPINRMPTRRRRARRLRSMICGTDQSGPPGAAQDASCGTGLRMRASCVSGGPLETGAGPVLAAGAPASGGAVTCESSLTGAFGARRGRAGGRGRRRSAAYRGLSQISGVDGSSGMAVDFALRFGGTP